MTLFDGGPADDALAEIAKVHRRHYRLDRWLLNGRSRARVAVVFEDDHGTGTSRRLLLKLTLPGQLTEALRHWTAYDDAPPGFAGAHLARPLHPPYPVMDGSWLTFAEIAGDDIEQVEVLTVLLNAMLDGTGCDPGTFARACGAVVGGILRDWTGPPRMSADWFTAERFLLAHAPSQVEARRQLHELTARYGIAEIAVPALTGRCHGDVHTDNVLVRVRPAIDGTDYHLVDLALYEDDGPVTRDPVHLLLYVLARRMDVLSAAQQSVLIDVLLAPDRADVALLPGWLACLIREIDGASMCWLRGTGLQPEWRKQRLLSLAGCAVLFLGRTSTRREDLDWFLRLAARAATAFLAATTAMPVRSGTAGTFGYAGCYCPHPA